MLFVRLSGDCEAVADTEDAPVKVQQVIMDAGNAYQAASNISDMGLFLLVTYTAATYPTPLPEGLNKLL
jgi:hypothetical protein